MLLTRCLFGVAGSGEAPLYSSVILPLQKKGRFLNEYGLFSRKEKFC